MDKQTSEPPFGEHAETNVGKDISESVVVTGNGNTINVGERKTTQRKRVPPEEPTKSRAKSARKSKGKTVDKTVLVALIGMIGTVVVGLLSSPLFTNWLASEPTSVPTATAIPADLATATEYFTSAPIIVVVTSTEEPQVVLPTFTPVPADTPKPSPEPEIDNMTVILVSSADEGKAPFRVNFDARTSYVKFADGSTAACGNNAFCSYVFAIYRDSSLVEKISNNTGTLSYTFGTRGQYFVTVYVTRGLSHGDDGLTVAVR